MVGRTPHVALLAFVAGCAQIAPVEAVPPEPSDWSLERDRLDQAVEARAAWADADVRAWTRSARLAETVAQRARHTGNLDDFEVAQDYLDRAFGNAAKGSGPLLEQARLDLSLHRFELAIRGAEVAMNGAVVQPDARSAALSVVGRSALELGDVDRAEAALGEAHALDPSALTWSDLAVFYGKIGEGDRSDHTWEEARVACDCSGARFDAWLELQKGLVPLIAGDPEAALPHFEEADRRYTGDWVIREHRAEALAALGRLEEADALYAQVIGTVRDAEVLAAWSEVRRELGHPDQADALVAEARAKFLDVRGRFPEAALGHAAAFFEKYGE